MNKGAYPAVYIADEIKKAKIRVKFEITDISEKPKESYDVCLYATVISGNKKLFEKFVYEEKGLVANQTYEKELVSETDASVAKEFSYSKTEFYWSGKVNNEPLSLRNTTMDIYIIPTTPCPPILMVEGCENHLIAVEYLQMITHMREKSSRQKTGHFGQKVILPPAPFTDLKEITEEVYFSECFKYEAAATKYISQEELKVDNRYIVGKVLRFKEKEFLKDIADFTKENEDVGQPIIQKKEPVKIECSVYAAILHYYFNLWQVSCRLAYVLNPVSLGNGRYDELHFVKVYPAGSILEASQNVDFSYHMIVEVPPQRGIEGMDGVCVFDASMGTMINGKILPLAGIPFYGRNSTKVDCEQEGSTYRGIAVQNNTGAVIMSEIFAFVKI